MRAVIDRPYRKQHYLGNRFSMFTLSGSGFVLGRPVVVKPVQRPRKIIVIHKARERAAAVLPARGVFALLSQRCTDRAAVSSKMNMLIPASTSNIIFVRKNELW